MKLQFFAFALVLVGTVACNQASGPRGVASGDADGTGCVEGSRRCGDTGMLQLCLSSAWTTGSSCLPGMCVAISATDARCDTSTECVDGASRCALSDVVQRCVGATWDDGTVCVSGQCLTSPEGVADCAAVAACADGSSRCSDSGALELCVAGVWQPGARCSGACISVSDTQAECQALVACAEGLSRCGEGDVIERCTDGAWAFEATCPSGVCLDSEAGATCAPTTDPEVGPETAVCTQSAERYFVCDGTSYVTCNGTTQTDAFNCADGNGSCFDYGDTIGADCVWPEGKPCVVCLNDTCSEWYPNGCGNGAPDPTIACGLYNGCTPIQQTCTPSAYFTPYCVGDFLVTDCAHYENANIPVGIDCADNSTFAGRCSAAGYCEVSDYATCELGYDSYLKCGLGAFCSFDSDYGYYCEPI